VDPYLQDLFGHQEWADAEHWRAFEAHSAAFEDKAIRDRLLHIHLVQHAFLWVTGPRAQEFVVKKTDDFRTVAELRTYAQQGLAELNDALKTFSASQIEEVIDVPWFRPLVRLSRRRALLQAAMHSHYHRGQNATRLRELGGVPPTTDFIVWLKNGQPPPRWS
jgi:uncharacterized damage-inducible protein DinB